NISIKEEDYGSNCTMNYTICGNDYSYDMNTGIVTILAQITSTNLCFGVHTYLQPLTKIILNPVSLAIDGIQTTTGDMPYVTASMSQTFTVSDISLMPKLSEWHIYGNEQQGRFSVKKPDYDPATDPLYYLDVLKSDVTNKNFFRILDKKQYELKDHLGNVRVAIGDMKIPTLINGQIRFYVDEKSVSDFYPGGMNISDRSWQGTSYRYGYNAQEKSLEIDASGNHHTAEFWEVNNASLRRWNTDPVIKPFQSGFSIFGNDPINRIDPNGDEDYITIGTKQEVKEYEQNKELKAGIDDIFKNRSKNKSERKILDWSNNIIYATSPTIRQDEAEKLSEFIIANHKNHPNEEINLGGYSYGGDVNMRLAILLNKHYEGKVKINIISLSTPLDKVIVGELMKLPAVTIEHTYIESDKTVELANKSGSQTFLFKDDDFKKGNFTQHKLTINVLKDKTSKSFELLTKYGKHFSFDFTVKLPFNTLESINFNGALIENDNHGWIYYRDIINLIYPQIK
ncbi:MAG: hypothetical protein NTW25_01485, partial [Candidatus Kapabacteria bacterium]|nr:hypothetical protein [Candidatus Kapabacteria bacterium]